VSQGLLAYAPTQTVTSEKAMRFSELGDSFFNELAEQMATRHKHRLLFEHTLKPEQFAQIRFAAASYISDVLGSSNVLPEQEMLARLIEARENGQLPNYVGTGLLMPKKEHILSFNALHKSMADVFFKLGGNDLIEAVDLPINLRMVFGKTHPDVMKIPFTSMKLHSDVWNGVHPDATVVVLPLFGDIDNITIEAGEMPRELELSSMQLMSDFNDGAHIPMVRSYADAKMQHGTMYFNDARGLHQTVRRVSEGLRISIDFRFRRKFNEAYRAMVPVQAMKPPTGKIEQDMSVLYQQWLKVGKESMMVFDETMRDTYLNFNKTKEVPLYIRNYRLVNLFE
jgi:hypothetical protein